MLRPALVLVFGMIVGCQARATPDGVQVLDSSGVRVVSNANVSEVDDADLAHWVVSPEPGLEIGVVDGPPEVQFFQVGSGAVLSDGTIVVVNGSTREVRYFDPEGRHVRSVGGQGEGPGEFQAVSLQAVMPDDSILLYDSRQRRATVLDRQGQFVRSYTPSLEIGGAPSAVGGLKTGSLVVWRSVPAPPTTSFFERAPRRVFVAGANDSLAQVGEYPGWEVAGSLTATFGRTLQLHAASDRIAVGTDDSYRIHVYDATGHLLHIVEQRRPPTPLTQTDFDRITQQRVEGTENPETQQRYREMPRPGTPPAFASLRVDRQGNLWVEELPPSSGRHPQPVESPALWQVFDRDGVLVARLETPFSSRVGVPGGLRLLDIGDTYVLGVFPDPLGVERVRLYPLLKTPR